MSKQFAGKICGVQHPMAHVVINAILAYPTSVTNKKRLKDMMG
jgi:hypothetical protein